MKKITLFLTLAVVVALTMPSAVFARQFEDAGALFGLGEAEPNQVLINLISAVLGLLGILAVIMIIFGGFRWMLSAGDEERVMKAKKTIGGAIVGLVIILLSWAIVNFVLKTASNVTGVT